MKVVGIIPARYKSSRLPGKPLLDINGKTMIQWTCESVMNAQGLDHLVVATDDSRIVDVCDKCGIKAILTGEHKTHINRVHEVSEILEADLYVVVCGDEPMIEPENVSKIIPNKMPDSEYYVGSSMRIISSPSELMDPGNIKLQVNSENECVMLSRSPIPFPYKTVGFEYLKLVGVECYNKKALDFFASKDAGAIERIEDITLLRFLENGISPKMTMMSTSSLSVDTEKDLEKVRRIMKTDNCDL